MFFSLENNSQNHTRNSLKKILSADAPASVVLPQFFFSIRTTTVAENHYRNRLKKLLFADAPASIGLSQFFFAIRTITLYEKPNHVARCIFA